MNHECYHALNRHFFLRIFRITFPVLMGYLAIGIAFGLLLVNAGYPWFVAPLMSLFIYAGAGQYAAVALFTAGTPLTGIAAVTFLINARHMIYGLSLINSFKNTGWRKPYLIFSLTDETYATLTSNQIHDLFEKHEKNDAYFFTALFNHVYWITGGVIGAAAGELIPADIAGVEFALTALFIVLAVERLDRKDSALAVLFGAVSGAAGIILFGAQMLIASILIGLAGLMIFKKRIQNAVTT